MENNAQIMDFNPHLSSHTAFPGAVSREDLAAVLTEIIVERATNLRFDLCVGGGTPTTDLSALLDSARSPWLRKHS